jgi:hypothetical protein
MSKSFDTIRSIIDSEEGMNVAFIAFGNREGTAAFLKEEVDA